MRRLRRTLRSFARALYVVLLVMVAALAPVAVLPLVYVAQRWRAKEVAVLVVQKKE